MCCQSANSWGLPRASRIRAGGRAGGVLPMLVAGTATVAPSQALALQASRTVFHALRQALSEQLSDEGLNGPDWSAFEEISRLATEARC